jgi:hypothetical protein
MSRCAAPDCTNNTNGISSHCLNHSNIFMPLYRKYKELEATVFDQLPNIDSIKNIPKLLSLYAKLEKVYNARKEYQEKAFSMDRWDKGHEARLDGIIEYMFKIEIKLNGIFSSSLFKHESTRSLVSIDDEEDACETDSVEIAKISEKNSRIIAELNAWNEFIPSIITENMKLKQDRDKYLMVVRNMVSRVLLASPDEKLKNLEPITYFIFMFGAIQLFNAYEFSADIKNSCLPKNKKQAYVVNKQTINCILYDTSIEDVDAELKKIIKIIIFPHLLETVKVVINNVNQYLNVVNSKQLFLYSTCRYDKEVDCNVTRIGGKCDIKKLFFYRVDYPCFDRIKMGVYRRIEMEHMHLDDIIKL